MKSEIKVEIKNSEIVINIYDLLEELLGDKNVDELDEIYSALAWFHPAYKELIDSMRDIGVGRNFNAKFFQLFKDFFILPIEYEWNDLHREKRVFRQMSYAMKEILKENIELNRKNRVLESVRQDSTAGLLTGSLT